jgi:hypothetical protein
VLRSVWRSVRVACSNMPEQGWRAGHAGLSMGCGVDGDGMGVRDLVLSGLLDFGSAPALPYNDNSIKKLYVLLC